MTFFRPATILASVLLAGCAVAPSDLGAPDDGSVCLQPALQDGGYHTQADFHAYTKSDIRHLVVLAYKVVEGSEVALTSAYGVPLSRDIANTSLGNPMVFGRLHRNTTYRFKAFAYSDAGTSNLISATGASSSVDVRVELDDRPAVGNLPVQLIGRSFSGQATAAIVISEGTLTSDELPVLGTAD